MTRFWLIVLICGLILTSAITAISPRLLTWYATPPVDIGVTCDTAIQWGISKLITIQIISLIIGGVGGALLYFWIRGKRQPMPVSSTKL